MRDRIQELRERSRLLEPDPALRADWFARVAAHGERFLESLPELPGHVADDADAASAFADPMPESGTPIAPLLETIARDVDRLGVNESAGHFFGFIPGSGVYAAALGDYLAGVSNRYVGIEFGAPGAVRLERQLVAWLVREIGFPPDAQGDLTSGGSIANLSAILAAREAHRVRAARVERTVAYLGPQTHHSVAKALQIAGLGECVQRIVPLDDGYRMDAAALARQVEEDRAAGLDPWLVVASAGATDTGVVDPLPALADVAERGRLWLHADAAYGGSFMLCEPGRARLRGLERAHSVVVDPHKGLFSTFGLGVVLVRDAGALARAYRTDAVVDADYLQDADRVRTGPAEPSEISPELTRPFRGLRLWLSLRLAGVDAFRAALEEKLLLARYFHEQLSADGRFDVGAPPDLSVVTFRLRAPERAGPEEEEALNQALIAWIQADGRIFLSSTRLYGRFTLRIAILNARTHLEHIDRALAVLGEGARALGTRSVVRD